MNPLETRAKQTLDAYAFFDRGDRVAVGVSGGADSVALLSFLVSQRETYALTLVVCHLNHSLRGGESDRDEAFVRSLAERWRLPIEVRRADVLREAERRKLSVEAAGRAVRYGFFEEVAGPGGKIATAHTLSDSMETLLFNLARGTGVRGLRGIPPRRGNIVRPLIGVTRGEVLAYLGEQGLPHVEDSTNRELDRARNRIRHQVLPVLEEINPALSETLRGTMDRLAEQWALTEALGREARRTLSVRPGVCGTPGFLALPKPVGDHILLSLLEERSIPVSARRLDLMRRTIAEGGRLDLAGRSWFLAADGREFSLRKRIPPRPFAPVLLPGAFREREVRCPVPEGRMLVIRRTVRGGENSGNICGRPLKNAVDCDKIIGKVTVRTRRPGDRMKRPGRAGTRTLARWQAEAGVPAEERDRLLLLADDGGVIWAERIGVAERVQPTAGSSPAGTVAVEECCDEDGPGYLQGLVHDGGASARLPENRGGDHEGL